MLFLSLFFIDSAEKPSLQYRIGTQGYSLIHGWKGYHKFRITKGIFTDWRVELYFFFFEITCLKIEIHLIAKEKKKIYWVSNFLLCTFMFKNYSVWSVALLSLKIMKNV